METFKRTPMQLFNLPQHFQIPLYQRPYVWKEVEQWEPLWNDVRRVTELRISDPRQAPTHFLGAVVIQAHEAQSRRLMSWNIVDGQQRLTTLQLLADATNAILVQAGYTKLAEQLEDLTHNSEKYVVEGDSCLKLRHLNKDRAAFDEVMSAEAPIDYDDLEHAGSRLVEAHRFFVAAVDQWLNEPDSADAREERASALTDVLLDGLQLVSIELDASENSQEIFETLNARGTPLTAADLVRNFVFQRLEAEGADTSKAYHDDWPFETSFWTKEVSAGRKFISRSSLFLNQWLTSRTGEEVSPQATFNRFKSWVEHEAGTPMESALLEIKHQALQYQRWTERSGERGAQLDAVEMAFYRMRASGVELLKPILIWLYEPGRDLSQNTITRIIEACESWVYRRQLLRLSGSSLGRVVADVIALHRNVSPDELADKVISYLARLNVTTTYWPGDSEIRLALSSEAVYLRYPRSRLRMFLEAIEDHYRSETNQPQIQRRELPIEHLLPRSWQDTWPVESQTAEEEREARVHRLGNLTLLTSSLNSKVSNGPWRAKRAALLQHNTVSLTGRVVSATEDREWSEDLIDQRTAELTDRLLDVWPVPDGHLGTVIDPQQKAGGGIELKHLMAAGMLHAGDTLVSGYRDYRGHTAELTADGDIRMNGRRFKSPSAAGFAARQKTTNGWYFWELSDGRRLHDVRADFLNQGSAESSRDPGSHVDVSE